VVAFPIFFAASGQKNLGPIQTVEVRRRPGATWASSKQLATFCRVGDIRIAMKLLEKTTDVRCHIPPKVMRDFAGVRGRVLSAAKMSPRLVSFSEATKQIERFNTAPSPRRA
jgi:hypothetical protein